MKWSKFKMNFALYVVGSIIFISFGMNVESWRTSEVDDLGYYMNADGGIVAIPIYWRDSIAVLNERLDWLWELRTLADVEWDYMNDSEIVVDLQVLSGPYESGTLTMRNPCSSMVSIKPETFPESTFAYQWEHCGRIIDSLNRRLSGMVSVVAVDLFFWQDTCCAGYWDKKTCGLQWSQWDSLKQARGL